jgi:phospholipid/cholesterol/gamma-HCH transport system permease protein
MNEPAMTGSSGTERPAEARKVPPFANLGREILEVFQVLGEGIYVFFATLRQIRLDARTRERVIDQLVRVGTDTLPLAALVSLFVGMVMVVQSADQLEQFTQEVIGSIVGLAMTKELGPVIMAFLIAGRVGSAVAAEIGSMKVYDEINALKMMDIDPLRFLAVPRLIALTLAVPTLVLYSDIIGIMGGALVVAVDPAIKISVNQYFNNLTEWVNATDVVVGLVKAMVFGIIVAVMSCTFGLRTRGGAEGVARSTTSAVVWSFVLIIVFDYLIVRGVLLLL